jgi:hypothetical protein
MPVKSIPIKGAGSVQIDLPEDLAVDDLSTLSDEDKERLYSIVEDYKTKNPDKWPGAAPKPTTPQVKTPAPSSRLDEIASTMKKIPIIGQMQSFAEDVLNKGQKATERFATDPAGGASDYIRAAGEGLSPLMLMNPMSSLMRAGVGAGTGYLGEQTAAALGAPEGVQELSGTLAGALPFGSPKIRGFTRGVASGVNPSSAITGGALGGWLGHYAGFPKTGMTVGAMLGTVPEMISRGASEAAKEPWLPRFTREDRMSPSTARPKGAIKKFSATVRNPNEKATPSAQPTSTVSKTIPTKTAPQTKAATSQTTATKMNRDLVQQFAKNKNMTFDEAVDHFKKFGIDVEEAPKKPRNAKVKP